MRTYENQTVLHCLSGVGNHLHAYVQISVLLCSMENFGNKKNIDVSDRFIYSGAEDGTQDFRQFGR